MRALADTQSFRDLIESGSVYVDKTEQIFSLLQNRRTFIARPYGFGKSLMLDTIGTLLGLGVEPYFRNTWIYGRWTEKSYPVLRLDFQKFSCSDHQKFCEDFDRCLAEFAGRNNFPYVPAERPLRSMKSLLRSLRSGNIRVAVLIDDYDAPLAANVSNPEMYERFRISMRELQGVMKGAPAISFLCIAAITRVKDPSEFPGGSDIRDMSYYGPVSAIAGFTREELIKYYGDFVARAVSLLKGIPEDHMAATASMMSMRPGCFHHWRLTGSLSMPLWGMRLSSAAAFSAKAWFLRLFQDILKHSASVLTAMLRISMQTAMTFCSLHRFLE